MEQNNKRVKAHLILAFSIHTVRVWGLLYMFGFWRSRPYQTWFIEVFPWEVNPSRPYQTQISMGSPFEGFPLSPLSNLAFDVKFCASRPRQTQLPGHPIACCELCCLAVVFAFALAKSKRPNPDTSTAACTNVYQADS